MSGFRPSWRDIAFATVSLIVYIVIFFVLVQYLYGRFVTSLITTEIPVTSRLYYYYAYSIVGLIFVKAVFRRHWFSKVLNGSEAFIFVPFTDIIMNGGLISINVPGPSGNIPVLLNVSIFLFLILSAELIIGISYIIKAVEIVSESEYSDI
jgi:hypothetical protein